ncbi:membrane-associated kinase regulator 5 [Beta vulgaris subsp. vulgaris]|uniref:membrane-associated kinase regulator 5 n=1 Tax=Beta vulgaris subsp. vulgaris TaxID=3555 RepID=UPI002036DA7E|nr:membrane-associated kinase regulator 5 [Beta vulgaris subsp. vulgaris]
MDVLTMLKFWKSNTSKVATTTSEGDGAETVANSTISDHLSEETDDDDDSFFELELTLPSYDSKFDLTSPCSKKSSKNDFNVEERESEPKLKSKPQSPISILRSAPPKLRVFMFGRFNKKSKRVEDLYETESVSSCYSPKRSSSSLFTVKFRIEDGSIVPKLTRSSSNNSSVSTTSPKIEKQTSDAFSETSKRFSKDVVQKYLNLIKPKTSKKYNDGEKFVASPTRSSTTSFPSSKKEKEEKQSSRFSVRCKQLGKCKSASAMIGVPSPANFPARNDHPQDGIEGAILHCKRSFTSPIGHSALSRCSSDPSHEKSIQVSEEI